MLQWLLFSFWRYKRMEAQSTRYWMVAGSSQFLSRDWPQWISRDKRWVLRQTPSPNERQVIAGQVLMLNPYPLDVRLTSRSTFDQLRSPHKFYSNRLPGKFIDLNVWPVAALRSRMPPFESIWWLLWHALRQRICQGEKHVRKYFLPADQAVDTSADSPCREAWIFRQIRLDQNWPKRCFILQENGSKGNWSCGEPFGKRKQEEESLQRVASIKSGTHATSWMTHWSK